ncbi:hypothetical protein G7Y89_g3520 [Cudoniella acicularis]|uniref:Uncharacterized protein n=1 Tax=Cudoniella acicularis TaxID=354080 RepID=A0A8H4RSF6_9HELO|nr:hypothetical protein G7Y89_g3520 [Cudoniella acicularis]
MNITIDRMNSAEQKVGEFRKIISISEHQEVASTCLTPSPKQSLGAVKRPRSETRHSIKQSSTYTDDYLARDVRISDRLVGAISHPTNPCLYTLVMHPGSTPRFYTWFYTWFCI